MRHAQHRSRHHGLAGSVGDRLCRHRAAVEKPAEVTDILTATLKAGGTVNKRVRSYLDELITEQRGPKKSAAEPQPSNELVQSAQIV